MYLLAVALQSGEPNWPVLIFSMIGGAGFVGGLGSLFYVRATGRKLDAEAHRFGVASEVALSDQALQWLREARDMSVKADAKAERCRNELDALRDHVSDVLEPMMREAGMKPPPFAWPNDRTG